MVSFARCIFSKHLVHKEHTKSSRYKSSKDTQLIRKSHDRMTSMPTPCIHLQSQWCFSLKPPHITTPSHPDRHQAKVRQLGVPKSRWLYWWMVEVPVPVRWSHQLCTPVVFESPKNRLKKKKPRRLSLRSSKS